MCRQAAKHRVDETGGTGAARLPGEIDARRDRRMRRYPIERRQLIGAQAQNNPEWRWNGMPIPGDQRSQHRVEGALPAEDAGCQLMGQPPVALVQGAGRLIEGVLENPSASTGFEGMDGGTACGGGA
jgi:hypothetical protein